MTTAAPDSPEVGVKLVMVGAGAGVGVGVADSSSPPQEIRIAVNRVNTMVLLSKDRNLMDMFF